ncbi:proteasome assembly chaperone 2-like isoform X2 [Dreissena polymorpha]|uniref:proteasome assembly chaperone 2-like isoform X2 n=1 Tax=Dreissena polymorpha TaxID=45954 RepID=UPI002265290A|nr:proteasome assembly chaperone 2-like isoform X2 [Dreissena polymorpha]
MFVPRDNKPIDFKGFTLIYPALSVGNVAQLMADLLISTMTMHKVGYIQHPSLIPLVGNDPYAHPSATTCKVVTCCEVYDSVEHNVVIVQQRSPFIKGRRNAYKKWLAQWIRECGFSKVVIATSSSADERLDTQITGPQFRFVASDKIEADYGEMFRNFYEWDELERRQTFPAPSVLEAGDRGQGQLYIPGGGIAMALFNDLCSDTPVVLLLMFCSEGDNIPEAIELTNRINRWLGLILFHVSES